MFISPTSCLSSPCYLPLLLHFFLLSQIFRGLSHLSVLSCPPHTVSCLLHGDTTRMSSTSFFTDLAVILLQSLIMMFLTEVWTFLTDHNGRLDVKSVVVSLLAGTHTHTQCVYLFLLPYWLLFCFAPLSDFMNEACASLSPVKSI